MPANCWRWSTISPNGRNEPPGSAPSSRTGDDLTHQIISTLNQTFVVPIDRHDILHLASALDDVIDYQEGIADLIELLPLTEVFPRFRTLVVVLARTCGAVVRAVGDLQVAEAIPPDIAAIKRRSARETSSIGAPSRNCTRATIGRSRS